MVDYSRKTVKYTPSTKFCGETECFSEYKIDIKNKIKEELDNELDNAPR